MTTTSLKRDSLVSLLALLLCFYKWESLNMVPVDVWWSFKIIFHFHMRENRWLMMNFSNSWQIFFSVCPFSLLQILFMNKIDLFQDKILHSGRHLRHYLPQFKGLSKSYAFLLNIGTRKRKFCGSLSRQLAISWMPIQLCNWVTKCLWLLLEVYYKFWTFLNLYNH